MNVGMFPFWLGFIDVNKVNESARVLLTEYQHVFADLAMAVAMNKIKVEDGKITFNS